MRIVYAEDNPMIREAIATLLVGEGIDVHEASDGGEAILLCKAFHPEVVLLDLDMPHMDGFEVARRLRELGGSTPRIIALTAHGDKEHQRLAERAGFDEFLSKPISVNTILGAIRVCS